MKGFYVFSQYGNTIFNPDILLKERTRNNLIQFQEEKRSTKLEYGF